MKKRRKTKKQNLFIDTKELENLLDEVIAEREIYEQRTKNLCSYNEAKANYGKFSYFETFGKSLGRSASIASPTIS